MFQEALKIAQQYTFPVIVSYRHNDNSTGSLIGAFIVLNNDGWILTACHIVQEMQKLDAQRSLFQQQAGGKSVIETDKSLNRTQRRQKMNALKKMGKKAITDYSGWWGKDEWHVENFHLAPFPDVAIGQIRGFKKDQVKTYPVFKNPRMNFDVGESLCKLGFPFHNVKPIYDETAKMFRLPPGTLPAPLFPMEGMFTRTAVMKDEENAISTEFVETSSPGLPGQSGGPTFDTQGRIWALQSRTMHLSLGSPQASGRQNMDQFHTGLGTHVNAIFQLLDENNVQFTVSHD